MEAPEYFAESWNSQSAPEKQGKDHFVVEDLLDFSNQEDDDNGVGEEEEACVVDATGNSTECSTFTAVDSSISSLSGGDQNLSGELLVDAGDLCEPLQHEELAELEWLSNFVEESFTSEEDLQKLQLISGVQSSSSSEATRVHVQSSSDKITDEAPADEHFLPEAPSVPAKARSKRSRAAACNWSSRLLVLPANADSAATPSSSDSDSVVIDVVPKKTPKKREPGGTAGPALAPSADGRRCLHCATDKTPQWRTGPMGPKTLCNACGVRYKSGRLVPEYRPASSPTFVLSRHSNSHRKVLELRRQKEMDQHQQQHALLHTGNSVYDRGAGAVVADDFLIHKRLCPDFRQLIQQ